MTVVITALIVINALLFAALGVWAILLGRRAESPYLRALAWVVSAACAAFVLSALQRIAVQAVTAGWLPDVDLSDVTTGWQLLQSVVALGIAVAGFWALTRTWGAIGLSQQASSILAGRLPDVDLEDCELTAREQDVVEVIRDPQRQGDRRETLHRPHDGGYPRQTNSSQDWPEQQTGPPFIGAVKGSLTPPTY